MLTVEVRVRMEDRKRAVTGKEKTMGIHCHGGREDIIKNGGHESPR